MYDTCSVISTLVIYGELLYGFISAAYMTFIFIIVFISLCFSLFENCREQIDFLNKAQ